MSPNFCGIAAPLRPVIGAELLPKEVWVNMNTATVSGILFVPHLIALLLFRAVDIDGYCICVFGGGDLQSSQSNDLTLITLNPDDLSQLPTLEVRRSSSHAPSGLVR